MLSDKLKFKLFANCIPVKGAKRSILCDLQREDYELIPNSLYEILTENDGLSFEDYVAKYGEQFRDTLSEYFNFLVTNEFGFWTDSPEKFPNLKPDWFYPTEISNAIVDWAKGSNYSFIAMVAQLEELGCTHVQLRFFDDYPLELIAEKMRLFLNSSISSIELYVKYNSGMTMYNLNELLYRNLRIERLFVHSSPDDNYNVVQEDMPYLRSVHFLKQEINSEVHCGLVHPNYYTINIPSFFEAKKFNSCLNRKISVDSNGAIKNCPSMRHDFGNISSVTLREALETSGFKDYWGITKDDIHVCQDCEFRYICIDCRAYTSGDLKNGKPSKCSYDPYTNQWNQAKNFE